MTRENWKIEINIVDGADDFPFWTIVSKAHGLRMEADTKPDLLAAIACMIDTIQAKYSAAAQAHARAVGFLDPKDDAGFDERFLGKDAFDGPGAS